MSFSLIEVARSRGVLAQLIEKAAQSAGANPLMVAFYHQVWAPLKQKAAAPLNPPPGGAGEVDHFQVHLIDDYVPFINRRELRQALRAMCGKGGRLFAVSGAPRTGKSFSTRFFGHIASQHNHFASLVMSPSRLTYGALEPLEFTSLLANRLRLNLDSRPQQQSQDPNWLKKLSYWITDEVSKSDRLCWLVVDDPEKLPDETRALLAQLLYEVLDGSPLRIVLLNFKPEQWPLDLQNAPRVERLGDVGEQDIQEFFHAIFRERGRHPAPEQVREIVRGILSLLPPHGDPSRLQVLHEVAQLAIERYVEEGQP
jgi:hypothetical protein